MTPAYPFPTPAEVAGVTEPVLATVREAARRLAEDHNRNVPRGTLPTALAVIEAQLKRIDVPSWVMPAARRAATETYNRVRNR